ncbi:MAG: FtsX-like permease family protein, partial [Myxococcota bacterium]
SLNDPHKVIARTQNLKGVAGASAFVLSEGMVSADKQLSGAVIKGIDVDRVDQVNALRTDLVAGGLEGLEKAVTDGALAGIVVGQEMAQQMDLDVGDTVQLVSPLGEELGPAGPVPKASAFRVAGIFYSGYFEYDAKFVYIGLHKAQQFFGLGKAVTGVEYATHNPETANVTAMALQQALGGYPYYTRDWRQMSHSLFSALQLEKLVMALILIALVAMASLLILVVLVMVAMQRRMQIAILKSIGASDVSIAKVFVTYGLTISGAGALVGTALGAFVCRVLAWAPVSLDPQVYYISQVPIQLHFVEIVVVAVSAVVLGFLATVPAALFAARQLPVEGLRDG